jgi:hypothetical protein
VELTADDETSGVVTDAGHVELVQAALRRDGIDALLLGGEAAGVFAAGHTRIGVHMPGWPLPVTVIPVEGAPHVVTADPDGAQHLPGDHVHGMMWNPATLVTSLPRWLGGSEGLVVGVDALSPGGTALVEAALPGARLVDATPLVAELMMAKQPNEVARLAELCGFVHAAADAGLAGGREALVRQLDGSFPLSFPLVGDERVAVAVRRDGIVGEARLGAGDAGTGERAVEMLRPGESADEVAHALPRGVEVVGIGWGYEAPLIRDGRSSPPGLTLAEGAVLVVRWDECGVTVALDADGARYLSPPPGEVAR